MNRNRRLCKLWRTALRQRLCCFENLFRPRPHPIILSQHSPPHHSGRVQKEFGRPRDITALFTLALVHKIVTASRIQFWIRKESEGVTGFLSEVARLLRSVNADRDGTDSGLTKRRKILLNAP